MNAQSGTRQYTLIAGILLVLLLATIGVAYVHLGWLQTPMALFIAVLKALLIMMFFMHLSRAKPLIVLTAAVGFFWLGILFVLTLSDYLTRH